MFNRSNQKTSRRLSILVVAVLSCNQVAGELRAQAPLNLRIIPLEEDNRGQPERTVRVQVQDISRGPLPGVRVTFTAGTGRNGGVFSNGARTAEVTTDQQGVAAIDGFRPVDPNARVEIGVEAVYMGEKATATMLSGGVSSSGGSSKKWVYILAGVGAGVLAAALLAGRKNKGDEGPTVITITPGAPAVGGP